MKGIKFMLYTAAFCAAAVRGQLWVALLILTLFAGDEFFSWVKSVTKEDPAPTPAPSPKTTVLQPPPPPRVTYSRPVYSPTAKTVIIRRPRS